MTWSFLQSSALPGHSSFCAHSAGFTSSPSQAEAEDPQSFLFTSVVSFSFPNLYHLLLATQTHILALPPRRPASLWAATALGPASL